jgi:sensor domain CHASE-containing protein
MSLRVKTFLISGALILILFSAITLISYRTVLSVFARLEESTMRQEVGHVLNALADKESTLVNTASDYAVWDDTYGFMQDSSVGYIADNLVNSNLASLHLNAMVFVKPSGEIVYAKGVDLSRESDAPLPADLLARLRSDTVLLQKLNEQESVSGLMRTSKGPLLVATHAILTTQGQGPRRGMLLVGRYLDAAEIDQITHVTGMQMDAYPLDQPPEPNEAGVLRALQQGAGTLVQPDGEVAITGYATGGDAASILLYNPQARAIGVSEADLMHAYRGALLHDIGKLGVPDHILLKPGKLTDEEWVIMRKHPQYAYDMIFPISYLEPAMDIPYCHHEKWDGSGYPRGLKGEEIPLAARIFAVVDVWDALTSDRPYRSAWPPNRVREYIRSQSGTHFDPRIVEAFFKLRVGAYEVPSAPGCSELQ